MSVLLSDQEWYEINLNPEKQSTVLGFPTPLLPPDDIQKSFTSMSGEENLRQAFSFYQYIRDHYLAKSNPYVMDFGCGWGRIARFFLKDTVPGNILAVDPYSLAVDWMRRTNLPCQIIKSNPLPPIPFVQNSSFDLIYAYSVFSHLSEEYFLSWINYLMGLLNEDGVLVFTTRGASFLDYVEREKMRPDVYGDYQLLRKRYEGGEILFLKTRGDVEELAGDSFGESFIPLQYLRRELPQYKLVEFTETVPKVGQAVIALKRA
ncbi:MAG: class I SAM-dependent methyltransferase [Ignavibacteriae bacterium]|nr:class I SAM-dependent methyltransferase [Ignavibacteriota bacterium]